MRRQFTSLERAAYTVGIAVEVLTGAGWLPGTVHGPPDDAGTGVWGLPVRCPRTAHTYEGEIVFPGPGAVRMAAVPADVTCAGCGDYIHAQCDGPTVPAETPLRERTWFDSSGDPACWANSNGPHTLPEGQQ